MSEEEAKLVTIDEEPNDQIVHCGRFRKANRATHETFDPRPQVDVITLDSLGILLADCMLLRGNMALVCPPSIGVKPRDPKRLQEILKFKKNRILSTPKDIRSYGATVMVNRMPQPPRFRFLAHITPHFVEL